MASERRFILLFLSLFVLLSALGAAVRRASPRTFAAPSVAPPQEQTARSAIDHVSVPLADIAQTPLQGLWGLGDRNELHSTAPSDTKDITIDHEQIISYYGSPESPSMGILGTEDLETIASGLKARAERYDDLNGDLGAVPAIHLVYAVAQRHPTANGLYIQYTSDEDVHRYLELAQRERMLLFLDLQIGSSSVAAEVRKALPYLRYPQVHLALDPEFAVRGSEVPGRDLGSLTADDVDEAQSILQQLVADERLPPKILIVHQFADSMLVHPDAIQRYTNVELVLDMDGFGAAAVKRWKYEHLAAQPYAPYAGIKLFFRDDPDMMSEAEVLNLRPVPSVIIYQ